MNESKYKECESCNKKTLLTKCDECEKWLCSQCILDHKCKNKYFKVKIEAEMIFHCSKEEILSMIYHDLYENMEILIKIKETKEISEKEAYER